MTQIKDDKGNIIGDIREVIDPKTFEIVIIAKFIDYSQYPNAILHNRLGMFETEEDAMDALLDFIHKPF